MKQFAVVTDSAADIPAALLSKYDISVVPLHIAFKDNELSDGTEISVGAFLDRLAEVDELPKTSQPSPASFLSTYNRLIKEGYTKILSVHLSGSLSGTASCAKRVAEYLHQENPGIEIVVIDSASATLGCGMMTLGAAILAQRGESLEVACSYIDDFKAHHSIFFVPDNLDNLVKGGRASKMQGLATSLLNIKIIVSLTQDGALDVVGKAKGMKLAASFIARQMKEQVKSYGPCVHMSLHTRAKEALSQLDAKITQQDIQSRRFCESTIGPTIATHVGSGAIGVLCYPERLHMHELDEDSQEFLPQF